jgi:hypothetical protein
VWHSRYLDAMKDLPSTGGNVARQGDELKHTTRDSGTLIEPPPGYRVVEVDTPSAARLRDLASLRRDFEVARRFADSYVAVADQRADHANAPEDALWVAAVIRYCRAFSTGARLAERASPEAYTDVQRTQHQRVLDLRNAHLAHAVNDFEQVTVVAYLTDSSFSAPKIESVTQMVTEAHLIDAGDCAALVALCDAQIASLERRMKRVQNEIGEELVALGRQAIYALPDLTVRTVHMNAPKKRRR